jgi:2-polyprenyl-6-methoxyphenol hydroxylase-like FAD-dependent oxidoreductase
MGQGAAMAIEDAVVLSRCIAQGATDLRDTFRLYEALRYERTTRVQTGSQHSMWLKDAKEDPGWLYRHDVLHEPLVIPVTNALAAHA